MNTLVTVQSYTSRIEAEEAKSFLEANGIKSIVFADDAGGTRPFPLAYTYGVELKVADHDLIKAKKLLDIENSGV